MPQFPYFFVFFPQVCFVGHVALPSVLFYALLTPTYRSHTKHLIWRRNVFEP